VITCSAIEGTCCDSCHEDFQLGWDEGGYDEMCMLYRRGAPLDEGAVAHVCCRKVDDAKAMLREKGIEVD
jgi:hypothetical protein